MGPAALLSTLFSVLLAFVWLACHFVIDKVLYVEVITSIHSGSFACQVSLWLHGQARGISTKVYTLMLMSPGTAFLRLTSYLQRPKGHQLRILQSQRPWSGRLCASCCKAWSPGAIGLRSSAMMMAHGLPTPQACPSTVVSFVASAACAQAVSAD